MISTGQIRTLPLRRVVRTAIGLSLALSPATGWTAVVTLCQTDVQTGSTPAGQAGVNLATAVAQGGTVTFACGGSATIRVTRTHVVDRDTRIEGLGAVQLDAGDRVRMFWVRRPGVTLRLGGLVLRGGRARPRPGGRSAGGGIVSGAANTVVELTSCRVLRSRSPIRSFGTVRLEDSELADNTGTALYARDISLTRSYIHRTEGVAIRSQDGTVVLTDTELTTNRASDFAACVLTITRARFAANRGERGGAFTTTCRTTITSSVFEGNQASGDGGAIYADIGGTQALVVTGTRFEGNTAGGHGGALALGPGWPTDVVRLRHVIFAENHADRGGGIHLGSWPTTVGLDGSALVFSGNTAVSQGGAIWATNSKLAVRRGVFVENRAGASGGAISVEDHETPASQQAGPLGPKPRVFGNVLWVRNRAPLGSAFIGSQAEFVNSTIADNQGPAVVSAGPLPRPAPIRFANTLLAANSGGNCAPAADAYSDAGHNLQHPDSGCGGTIGVAEPRLDEFYVPWLGSPALDAGDPAICAAEPINGRDVFGHRRPHRSRCTIGAAESDVEDLVRRRHRFRESGRPPRDRTAQRP